MQVVNLGPEAAVASLRHNRQPHASHLPQEAPPPLQLRLVLRQQAAQQLACRQGGGREGGWSRFNFKILRKQNKRSCAARVSFQVHR